LKELDQQRSQGAISDDDGANIEKDSDYFGRRDNETRSLNMTDVDGRSDNYLAEIRRISHLKPNNKNNDNFNRSRSPLDMASKDPFQGINNNMK
jgi:hypothetical protein